MPWSTPTLRDVRTLVRDAVNSSLPGADATVPNSVLRVLSDNQGALCHLTLQYIDWLSLQLLPDTAETEWLDRHGQIWLVNADGSTGRKMATLATGTAEFQGIIDGTVIPTGTQLQSAAALPVDFNSPNSVVTFETLEDITTSASTTVTGNIRAVDAGSFGNLPDGSGLSLSPSIPGVSSVAFAYNLTGGTDTETDDELRARILQRIRNPPMGGAQADYVSWALAVPGVTRAWANVEQGIGTMTVRFMMEDLRADNDGFPLPPDVATVGACIDKMRPVTVKDCFVAAPIKFFVDLTIADLNPNTEECKAEIEAQLKDLLLRMAAPGQTIYSAWISAAIMQAPSVISFDLLTNDDFVMPNIGSMAVLGTILYE
ncbi:baseplate J/gp47 family protein [Bradyrhizobium sp. DASA03120]|uniref:baseplate J/gp47 family protein n=1 Tax=Bradyrhizobium sp. SMVTL-02 TaxID=3395917 RepID=UPI003F704AA4